MAVSDPSIQGIGTPENNTRFGQKNLGSVSTFMVDSSNPFYTTQSTSLAISATTFTAPTDPNSLEGSLVFTFSGSPDLSEVMVGNYLKVHDCEDRLNTGTFEITGVNDGADQITVKARKGTTNASSSGSAETMPFFGAFRIECLTETSGLSVSQESLGGASLGELAAGEHVEGYFTEVTISTSGLVRLYLM